MPFSTKVKELRLQGENVYCLDCNVRNTQWTSLSYGIFLCMECAGIHRSFGVRVSVVRSVNMDKWTEEGYLKMKLGGNEKFKDFLRVQGIISLPIRERYKTDAVRDYMVCLKENVENELPESSKELSNDNRTTINTTQRVNTMPKKSFSYVESSVSSPDIRSSVSSAIHKITDFVAENALYLKDKGVQVGSRINESVLRPSTTYLREKGRGIYSKFNNKEDKKVNFSQSHENVQVKYKDTSKWD